MAPGRIHVQDGAVVKDGSHPSIRVRCEHALPWDMAFVENCLCELQGWTISAILDL